MHPSSARPLPLLDGAQPSTRAPAARPPLSAVRAHLEPLHGDAHPLAAVANNWLALAATRRKTASLSDKFRSTFGSKRQKAEGPSFQIWLLSHSSFELTPSTHIRHTSACRDHMLPPWWRGVAFCLVCPAPCTHTYKLSGIRALSRCPSHVCARNSTSNR